MPGPHIRHGKPRLAALLAATRCDAIDCADLATSAIAASSAVVPFGAGAAPAGAAASGAAGLRANFGTMVKPLHAGQAARTGLQAALRCAGQLPGTVGQSLHGLQALAGGQQVIKRRLGTD